MRVSTEALMQLDDVSDIGVREPFPPPPHPKKKKKEEINEVAKI